MSFPISVGKYQLLQLLGEGNFALVYKARHIQTKKIVAVKKMKKLNKQDVQMVKKEIEIMKDLKHKNIVEYITDFRQRQNGDWYIVLEYCGKGDMEKYKKKVGKVPEAHCKLFVRNILQALVELHKRKIAHRDLKLANILINDDYKLKLADFGFSKDYQTGYMRSFCGTPLSMAPEILKRQNYNEKCDVWSLGVLTFMMLYNRPPFFPTRTEGMGIPGITNAVTLRNHKFDDTVQVSEICKQFINACLQKQASKRPSTKQLLNHEWFSDIVNSAQVSTLRVNAIKNSIKQKDPLKQQANKLCEQMLFGVFESHLKKMSQTMLINFDIISRLQHTLVQYYPSQNRILECYFLIVLKKLQELTSREVIYVLDNSSYKIKLAQLKKFKEFQTQIVRYIENNTKEKTILQTTKINVEKDIVKFCLNQTELLIECINDEEINEKLFLLKTLCKFVTTDYQSTMLDVKWGDRKDLAKYVNYISEYFKQINQQIITKVINQQPYSDQDLESTWLIQHHLRQSKISKNLQTELGKLALYVLNIPTNFSSDKLLQTQKIQLDQQSWLQLMKSFN